MYRLVAGVLYPMGASSSPDMVLITRVGADGSFSYRHYPYQNTDSYAGPSSARSLKDLILTACHTEQEHMTRVCKRGVMDTGYVPEWCREKLAFVEMVIRGETPPAGDPKAIIEGYKPVRFRLRVATGTPDSAFDGDRGDPWYAAENYGGLASSGDGADTIYHVHGKQMDAVRAMADTRFELMTETD
jgi:hypothetical protein